MPRSNRFPEYDFIVFLVLRSLLLGTLLALATLEIACAHRRHAPGTEEILEFYSILPELDFARDSRGKLVVLTSSQMEELIIEQTTIKDTSGHLLIVAEHTPNNNPVLETL